MSGTTGTLPEGGIGIHQAQDAIANLLASDGDTQDGEAQQPDAVEAKAEGAEGTEAEATEAQAEETDAEDSAESEDGEQQEQQPDPVFTVKVNGEEVQVTLDELQRGYSRQADYSRKTQQLAEERKAFQGETEAIRQERAQYATLLGALQQQLQATAQLEQQPDWDRLYDEDPIQATKLERQWRKATEERHAKLAAIQAEQQRVSRALDAQQGEALKQHLIREADRMPELIPEWKDATVASKEKTELRSWLENQGLNQVEIDSLTRAEHVALLRKAFLYDRGQRKAQAAVKPQPQTTPPVRPGAVAAGPKQASELTRARQRLAKTGTVNDAAAAIAALI